MLLFGCLEINPKTGKRLHGGPDLYTIIDNQKKLADSLLAN